mgnify:CR=1 FL=1
MKAKKVYNEWKNNDYFDEEFLDELRSLKDQEEINDRFYKFIEFGTAGMRGVIGAGTNRMNKYIVRRATQGFANYLKKEYKDENLSIAIGYDPRNKSELFSKEAALVMAANGIKAYLYKTLKATPQLSYAVRELNCVGGIMITASHNPAEYNGYKVYDDTGCQLVPEKGNKLKKEVNSIEKFEEVNYISLEKAKDNDLFEYISDKLTDDYIEDVKTLSINKEIFKETDLKVVYSPLHGSGAKPVTRVLKELGLKNLIEVNEQMVPDGEFTTIKNPNPESNKAFELSLKYGQKEDADILICTDPDGDRVGLMVKNNDSFKSLNGNQIGVLLLNYILQNYKGDLEKGFIVNSIVTSGIVQKIAEKYNIEHNIVLTGFKYIGDMINKKSKDFIFGFEESYGYLKGTFVRDKDAVVASMLIVEMVAFYKSKGINLIDQLNNIYDEFGYFLEEMIAVRHEGKSGEEKIKNILSTLRKDPIKSLAGKEIVKTIDCLKPEETNLPKANVLKSYFKDGSWFAIRPSGTEPKIKFYFSIKGKDKNEATELKESIKKDFFKIVDSI